MSDVNETPREDGPLDETPKLPEDSAQDMVQTQMFTEHPEVGPVDAEPPEASAEAGSREPEAEMEPLWEEGGDLPGALEALVTAAGEVLDIAKLRELTGFHEGALRQGIEALQARAQAPCGLRLVEVGGGWRMATAPHYQRLIGKLVTTVRSGRLTPAQLEVLAIVGYRQPITITEINAIRGVTSSANQIKSLMERDLVTVAGRKPVVGRPMMYATTQGFLLHFGLKSLFDLPRLADFGEGHLEAQALAQLEPELEEGLFAHPIPEEAAEYEELPEEAAETEAAPEEESPRGPDEA